MTTLPRTIKNYKSLILDCLLYDIIFFGPDLHVSPQGRYTHPAPQAATPKDTVQGQRRMQAGEVH